MLVEQIEQLRSLNADLAAAVEAEREQVRQIVVDLRATSAQLQTTVDELKAKLAEVENLDLSSELNALTEATNKVKNLAEDASA